jgi:hypothetical protein
VVEEITVRALIVARSWRKLLASSLEDPKTHTIQPYTALAKFAKNSSASFLAVPLIRR